MLKTREAFQRQRIKLALINKGIMLLISSPHCPEGNCFQQSPSTTAYSAVTACTAKPNLLEGSRAHRVPVKPPIAYNRP